MSLYGLFGSSTEPDRALGANIAGCMVGGLAEHTVMLLGFQYLVLVALAFYALSAVLASRTVHSKDKQRWGPVTSGS